MLVNGLYRIAFQSSGPSGPFADYATVIVRDGSLLGSDQWGVVFAGTYASRLNNGDAGEVHLQLKVPPGGELVTGFSAGAQGAIVDIVARLEIGGVRACVEIAGQPLEVDVTFLSPLPV